MKDLPLNALRAFATIRACGGVRAAARQLGIAHSSVSRHLAELESWLGVELVHGGGRRGLVFTPQGESLGNAVVAGLRDIDHAVEAIRETRSASSVTISTTPSFATRWLLPRLPAFERAHKAIELSVVVDQRIVDLETSGIDLAIRMGTGSWPDARSVPLMEDALYPVASPTYLATMGHPRRPKDLARLRLLHDRDPNASWETWRRVHGPAALDVRRGPRFSSSDLVLRAASQGQGVALARDRLARDEIASGALVRLFSDLAIDLGVAYWILLPRREARTSSVGSVVDWLVREA